jgi:hypothetical protein
MVLNVLNDVPQVLTYLSKLKNQSVFNFCAIPQVMAIATLSLVFNNLDIYQRNIKIRKGQAVKLIMDSTDMDNVVAIFRQYVFEISRKNEATDPNFMEISMSIGRVSCIFFFLYGFNTDLSIRSNNGSLQIINLLLKPFKRLKHLTSSCQLLLVFLVLSSSTI